MTFLHCVKNIYIFTAADTSKSHTGGQGLKYPARELFMLPKM